MDPNQYTKTHHHISFHFLHTHYNHLYTSRPQIYSRNNVKSANRLFCLRKVVPEKGLQVEKR